MTTTPHHYHWRHGWIPLDHEALMKKYHGDKTAVRRAMARTNAADPKTADTLIHAIKANGGFTYDPTKGRLLQVGKDKGFAVAVPGTEQLVGNGTVSRDEFAKGVAAVVKKHANKLANGHVLGGWYSEDRDAYMVELTQIMPANDRAGAIREGTRRNQEGIFDLSTGDYIPTGGTGDALNAP
jgi:hypothetical protein